MRRELLSLALLVGDLGPLIPLFCAPADMGGHTNTEEDVMSEPRTGKTLGIKLPDALHAQFALVAQLDGISLGDAALRAVELYVSTKRQEPDFAARAQAALEEIAREAAVRRGAIEGLFGTAEADAGSETTATKPTSSRSRKAPAEPSS